MMSETQTIEELEIIIKANVKEAIQGIKQVVDEVKKRVNESIQSSQKVQEYTKQIGSVSQTTYNQVKNSLKSVGLETNSYKSQQEHLLFKLDEMKETLEVIKNTKPYEGQQKDIIELESSIEKVTNQYNKLIEKQNKASSIEKVTDQYDKLIEKQDETSSSTEKNNNKSFKSFDKLWSSIKRGTLTILKVRTAINLLRNGMNSALNTSEEIQAQQRITSNAIGQIFIPVMKKAQDVVQYLVIGISLLIKYFTGFDALAKVTSKNIQDTANSTKELNRQLSSMDEIENLQDDSNTSMLGNYANDLKALEEFKKKIKEVEDLFNKWDVAGKVEKTKKVIQETWKIVKPIFDWCLEHPTVLTALFSIFMGNKLANEIKNVIGSSSSKSGLAGVLSLSQMLMGIGVIAIALEVATIVKDTKELKKNLDGMYDQGKKYAEEEINGYSTALQEAIDNGTLKDSANNFYEELVTNFDAIDVRFKNNRKNSSSILQAVFGESDNINEQFFDIIHQYENFVGQSEKLLENTELTEDQYKGILEYTKNMHDYLGENLDYYEEGSEQWKIINEAWEKSNKLMDEIKYKYLNLPTPFEKIKSNVNTTISGVKETFNSLTSTIAKIFDKTYKINVDGDTSKLTNSLTDAFSNVSNKLINSSIGNSFKNIFSNKSQSGKKDTKIKLQAKGNVAYEPTLGITGEYPGVRIDPEITAPQSKIEESLENSLMRVLPLLSSYNSGSGEAIFNLNGREFARAIYNNIEDESNRRNQSMAIRRIS